MSKRTVFTTVTPLPAGLTRETVLETLHNHVEMIDLNPLVEERHPIKPPPNATPEEFHCTWYSLTDRVQYLPGGMASGKVSYNACFHDLAMGVQTHCYAPLGLNIKGKWTLGGSLPGEPIAPIELGVGTPLQGLWLREDVDMKCNFMMTGFVKKTLKNAHSTLVDRLMMKAKISAAMLENQKINSMKLDGEGQGHGAPGVEYSPASEYSVASFSEDESGRESWNTSQDQRSSNSTFEDPSLAPKPLSVRSSSSTFNSSVNGGQGGRLPYVEGSRVSWQQLHSSGVGRAQSPMQQLGQSSQQRNSGPSRNTVQSQAYIPADYVGHQRSVSAGRVPQQLSVGYGQRPTSVGPTPPPPPPPKKSTVYELE